jgi:hypothetical protein
MFEFIVNCYDVNVTNTLYFSENQLISEIMHRDCLIN